MHKLTKLAVALLLGLLLASASGARNAAAQNLTTGPTGFSNPSDAMIDIFFPRNSSRKESNSKDAAAVQQTRQPGFGNRVAQPPARSKPKNHKKRRNARRRPPAKDVPLGIFGPLPDLSAYGGISGYLDPDPFIRFQLIRAPNPSEYGDGGGDH